MLTFNVTFILLLFIKVASANRLIDFLADFFDEKNVTVTANICWPYDEIMTLSNMLFMGKNPKQIAIHTEFSNTDFLHSVEHDNYIIVDISCRHADSILKTASHWNFFNVSYHWLLINSEQKINELILYDPENNRNYADGYNEMMLNYLREHRVFIDSEVICAENTVDRIRLWQYYYINRNFSMFRERYGEWTEEKGVRIQLSHNITSYRRKNLKRGSIRIVMVINTNETLKHLHDFRYPMIDLLTKGQVGILMALMYYLNSSYIIVPADSWGIKRDDGLWDGMSGVLQRKEADISGTGMYYFKTRLEFGKFLKLTNPTVIAFVFRKPPLSYEQNIYSLPFAFSVWISYVGIVILITVLLVISSHYENERNTEIEKVYFGTVVLLVAAAVCQQGTDIVPTGVPGRILTLVVFTALMFLSVSYSANIVTLLQSTSDSIKNLEDLLHSRMRVGAESLSYNYQYFMNATEPIKKAVYKEKMGPNAFYELSAGVEKIRQGLFAFHAEEGSIYFYILKTFNEREKCECVTIPGVFQDSLGWVSCPSDSPYGEIFKIGLMKAHEYGLQQRFLKRFYRKTKCTHVEASFTSVGIVDFYPAILVYTYAVSVAIVIFVMEHIYKRYSKRRARN